MTHSLTPAEHASVSSAVVEDLTDSVQLCFVMVKTNWPEETTRQYREKSNSQTGNVNGRKKGKGGGVGEMSIQ